MNKLGLDFKNRIVSIVSSSKTVIAFMDDELRKKDFLKFFPNESVYATAENVTFDFENHMLRVTNAGDKVDMDGNVKEFPMPTICLERQSLLDLIRWDDAS